jgi:hypothetical protein
MAFNQFPQKGGIPSGVTAGRPSNPAVGDTYYNGTLGLLEIYTTGGWQPCSAPPSTPVNVVATALNTATYTGTASLNVAFDLGSGGGLPTNFLVYTTAGGFSSSASTSPITISGLTLGSSYTTYVIAQNGFGNSAASGNSNTVTVSTKPQAPTIGTASTGSTTTDISVTWTNGNNGSSNLTTIVVTPYLNGTTAQSPTTVATSATSATVSGLTSGSNYTFKVKATNANGDAESSATNSVTIPTLITASYLVVAGGGGNAQGDGGNREGGSGAGGMRTGSTTLLTGTTYTVSVGAGGTGQANGVNSSITGTGLTTISCTGGGKGGNADGAPAGNGGNGGSGGGAWYVNAGGTGVSGEGNAGSGGFGTSEYGGAGGGKGGAGGRGPANGPGEASSITGTSVTYATGGQANDYPSTTRNANGAANTGTGASGRGNGGSGIVVFSATNSAVSTTGSPTVITNGSYTVYKFTGDGTITY